MLEKNKKTLEEEILEYIEQNRDNLWFKLEELLYDLTEHIYERMVEKNMTQRELARRLGVSDAYISKILKGHPNITLKTLVKLAIALDLDVKIYLEPEEASRYRQVSQALNRNWQSLIDGLMPESKEISSESFARAA